MALVKLEFDNNRAGALYIAYEMLKKSFLFRKYFVTFDWDEINGVPGAFIIRMAILKLLQSDQNNGKP